VVINAVEITNVLPDRLEQNRVDPFKVEAVRIVVVNVEKNPTDRERLERFVVDATNVLAFRVETILFGAIRDDTCKVEAV